ncbi:hypothetical protein HDU86_003947 [Geranomyces michiganensis]|nr:hypothetical protein HDU86_003947 [Geranomyces michiganensis]
MSVLRTGPVGPAEFAAVFKRLAREDHGVLGVGVSGDSKSLATLLLLKKAVGTDRVVAFTVDHGLKDGTATEAARIGRQVQNLGVAHHVLPVAWEQTGSLFINDRRDPPRDKTWIRKARLSGLVEALRIRRANVLARACREQGIKTLVIGHSLNDQVRVTLGRMRTASGIEGLAGLRMCDPEVAPASTPAAQKIELWRPVLCFSQERLAATCSAHQQTPHDGPTNPLLFLSTDQSSPAFHGSDLVSPRTGAALPIETHARFLEHMDLHRRTLAMQVTSILKDHTLCDPSTGTAFLQIRTVPKNIHNHWISKPHIANRVIQKLVTWASLPKYERAASISAIFRQKVISRIGGEVGSHTSLGSVILCPPQPRGIGAGIWVIGRKPMTRREETGNSVEMRIGDRAVWDARFRIALKPAKTPAPFYGIDPSQVRFVVRHYSKSDEAFILNLMEQNPHTEVMDEVAEQIKNYRKRMPALLHNSIPCVAVMQDNGDTSFVIAVPSLRVNLQPTLVDIQFAFVQGFGDEKGEGVGFALPSE